MFLVEGKYQVVLKASLQVQVGDVLLQLVFANTTYFANVLDVSKKLTFRFGI